MFPKAGTPSYSPSIHRFQCLDFPLLERLNSSALFLALEDFIDTQNRFRHMSKVFNPTNVDNHRRQKKVTAIEDVLNWQS